MDYLETFSPTANTASMRLLIALACKYNLELLHWDIEQAFVQSELDHEVFMSCLLAVDRCQERLSVWARIGTDFGRHLERSTKDY